jgi:type IV pilus assembly protein PilB
MRLGELLIMNGWITDNQLEEALEAQSRITPPKKLGQVLVDNGRITERQLVEALEFQLGVPFVDILNAKVDLPATRVLASALAREYEALPLEQSGNKIIVAMADPLNHEAVRAIQIATGMSVQPLITTRKELAEALVRYYGLDESAEALNEILQSAVRNKASAIHIEPQENGLIVSYRMGPELRTHKTLTRSLQEALTGRIRKMACFPLQDQPVPQYNRVPLQIDDTPFDVEFSSLPTPFGSNFLLRLKEPPDSLIKMVELGFDESHAELVNKALNKASGLIVVSGPPKSGRTTTLYAMLHRLASDSRHALTLEDPIERRLFGVTQVAVGANVGVSFAQGVRAALRHDPDVVMVGELGDSETLETSIRAAWEGRLVLGAVQASSAVRTLGRLMTMAHDAELLAASLELIVSQRLVRSTCRQCAQSVPATDEETVWFEQNGILSDESKKNGKGLVGNFRSFVSGQINGKLMLNRGTGCRMCNETGFRGMTAVQELLTVDPSMKEMIAEQRPISDIEKHIAQSGFQTLKQNGLLKVRDGITTADEIKNLSSHLMSSL